VSEHFSEQAIGESYLAWCTTCSRMTMHRMDRVTVTSHASKPGPCLEHGPRVELTKAQAQRRAKQKQRELFP